MALIVERMIRAAKLEVSLYEEVEADVNATGQAMMVVVLSSLAEGIGALGVPDRPGLIAGTLAALVGWFLWAMLTYFIGTKLLPTARTEADLGQLLRTIGFSSSPGVLRILAIIPGLYGIISFIISIWMLVAMVIAVRQALDYDSTFRAVLVCVIGWLVYIVFLSFAAALFM